MSSETTKSRDRYDWHATPKQQAIRVISVQETESKRIFLRILPVFTCCIEPGIDRECGKRGDELGQRRMFGIYSEVPRSPVAVSGHEVNGFILSCR